MAFGKKTKSIVGLDISAASVAATEIATDSGGPRVVQTAMAELAPGLFRDGEVVDAEGLAAALEAFFAEHKLPPRVRMGLANQRVAVRTLRMPRIEDDAERETAIRFQAQDHVPMPLDQAVLEHQLADAPADGDGDGDEDRDKMLVVLAAARRDMVASVVRCLRSASLRPDSIDVAAFGMIRALRRTNGSPAAGAPAHGSDGEAGQPADAAGEEAGPGSPAGESTALYCDLGDNTNLAVATGATCLFTRVAAYGVEGIAQRLAERRRLSLEHARLWLNHVGLEREVDQIEGDAETIRLSRECLEEGAAKLAHELRLALEYFSAQDGSRPVEAVKACGIGTAIPGLVSRLGADLHLPVQAGRPPALRGEDDQRAARLTVSYGIALDA